MEGTNENIFVELAKAKTQPAAPLAIKEGVAPAFGDEADGQLTVDVYQDKDDIIVQSAVAGVHEDDLDIHITNDSVTIRGKRERSQKIEEKDYFYQECFWGTFSRTVIHPAEVDPEKSVAALKNGVLTVRMPKLSRQRSKKLKVKMD